MSGVIKSQHVLSCSWMQLAETRHLSLLRARVYELVCIYELETWSVTLQQDRNTCLCLIPAASHAWLRIMSELCSAASACGTDTRMWPDKNELRPSSVLSGTPWGGFCSGSFLVTSSSLKSQQWMVQSCCCLVDLAAGPVGGCKRKVVFRHGYIKMCGKKNILCESTLLG